MYERYSYKLSTSVVMNSNLILIEGKKSNLECCSLKIIFICRYRIRSFQSNKHGSRTKMHIMSHCVQLKKGK